MKGCTAKGSKESRTGDLDGEESEEREEVVEERDDERGIAIELVWSSSEVGGVLNQKLVGGAMREEVGLFEAQIGMKQPTWVV